MNLVNSVKAAKESVGQAFDQLVSDIEAGEVEAPTPTGEGVELVKVTAFYSDGSTVDLTPGGDTAEGGEGVKDLTEDAPKSDTETPPQGAPATPGNSEQL